MSSNALAPPANIHQRILQVQKSVKAVVKNDEVQVAKNRSYKAVSHDDVAALLHLPLAEAGIVLLPDVIFHKFSEFEFEKTWNGETTKQKWHRCDLEINVKWINADDPKDFIESHSAAFALDTSDKCFSKAYSLALKICLLKVHLLESRDEEEARIFEQTQPTKVSPKPITPAPGENLPPPLEDDQSRWDALMTDKPVTKLDLLLALVDEKRVPYERMPGIIRNATGHSRKASELTEMEIDKVIKFLNLLPGGQNA